MSVFIRCLAIAGLVLSLATMGCGGENESSPAQGGSGGDGGGGSGGTGGDGGTGGLGGTGGVTPTELCDNTIDDDDDGDVDCDDEDCANEAVCLCGNGALDEGEDCDGAALGGRTCVTLGYAQGTLACTDECELDESGCSNPDEICDNEIDDDRDGDEDCDDADCADTPVCLCGNGELDGAEACDGAELGGATCLTLDYEEGVLACDDDCTYDASDCRLVEDCADGADDDGDGEADCADADCQDATGCNVCGDGRADPREDCDGADLAGETCLSQGYLGGTLACADCEFETTACDRPEVCSGDVDEDHDNAIDCADSDCAAEPNCVPGAFCHTALVATGDDTGSTIGAQARFAGTCPTSGSEQVWVYTPGAAGQTGNLHVTLTSTNNLAFHVRTACGEPASEQLCVDAAPGGVVESADVLVQGGVPVYVIVDAASPLARASYRLQLAFDPCGNGTPTGAEECDPPNGTTCGANCRLAETDCTNLVDDDLDGRIDCQDPTRCQGVDPLCTPGAGGVGTACDVPSDCASVAGADPICWTELHAGFPSGMCSEACDLATPDCPAGSVCLDVGRGNGSGSCYRSCTTAAECPSAGYRCGAPTGGTATVCLPGCTADAECPATGHCNATSGLCTAPEDCTNARDDDHDLAVDCFDPDCATHLACIPPELECANLLDDDGDGQLDCRDSTRCRGVGDICTPGTGAVGTACTASNQCASALGADPACIDQWTGGFAAGYCSELCDIGANDCPAGSACVDRGIPLRQTLPPSTVGVCMNTCTSAGDCGAGWTCASPAAGAPSLCVPVENCGNTFDDDFDGATDCADTECAGLPQCQTSGTCGVVPVAGAVNTGTTVGAGDDFDGECQQGGAPEVVYRYSPNQPGTQGVVTFTLSSTEDLGFYVRTTCDDALTELGCLDDELGGVDEVGWMAMNGGDEIFVFVDGWSTGDEGSFTLSINYQIVVCGNGTAEPSEGCDDGNTVGGDGCSATCQTEPESEPNDTPAAADPWGRGWTGALPSETDVDWVRFTVPGPSSTVTVQTVDANGYYCDTDIDTVLDVVAADGTTVLGHNDDDPGSWGYCSAVTVTGLSAGTYYAKIVGYYDPSYPYWPFEYGVEVTIQ